MSGKNSKKISILADLNKIRDRKLEIAEGLFLCPFQKGGERCQVARKFRSLKAHCENMHGGKIALKCVVGDCGWSCVHSIRCLTSHRDNLEIHGELLYTGVDNLDGTCVAVRFHGGGEHFPQCLEAKRSLKRYTQKMKKREDRAASAKLKNEALKKAFKHVKVATSKQPVITSKGAHPPKPSKAVVRPEGGLNAAVTSPRKAKLEAWKKNALAKYVSAIDETSDEEAVDDVVSTTSNDVAVANIVTGVIPTTGDLKEHDSPTHSKNSGKGSKNPSFKKAGSSFTGYFQEDFGLYSSGSSCGEVTEGSDVIVPNVKSVVSSQKKRKIESTHTEKSRPLKKRRSACEFPRQPIVEFSVPVSVSPASGEVVTTPAAKVTQPKEGLSTVQLKLEARLNHMRENGFEEADFRQLLRNFGLKEVLNLVDGEDRTDQKFFRNGLASLAYQTLRGQAVRYSRLNPLINK